MERQWILPWFLGNDFAGAANFIMWIALGMSADGMNKMVVGYIYYEKKTYILAWVTFISGLLSVVLNYLFIKKNGATLFKNENNLLFSAGQNRKLVQAKK